MTKMRKKYVIIASAAVIVLISVFLMNEFWPRKPFADLKQEDVSSVDVFFGTYPNYEISKTDQEKLVSLLQTVTVTSKSDAYKQLDAKSYSDIFIFHMTDKDVSVEPFSPYLIIDGTGYKCNNKDTLNTMNDMFTSYIEVIRQTTKPSGSN